MADTTTEKDKDLADDRRRFQRVAIPESYVHCNTDGHIHYYALGDLSVGGARLRGTRPLSPGAPVDLIFFLPLWDTTSVEGRVQRVTRDGNRFFIGVEFDPMGLNQEARFIELLRREIKLNQGPVVLWASERDDGEPDLQASLQKGGFTLVRESTPLGIVARLDDPTLPVEMVYVEGPVGAIPLPELLRFLRRTHPALKLYVVGDLDETQWDEVRPLVADVLEPGTGRTALQPTIS